jgi:O-antigen/teichoic acid export membrane protein
LALPKQTTSQNYKPADALRDLLALGIGNYGAIGVGLIVNTLLARQLGTEQYGRLALMLMASQVLLLVAVNWTHAAFVRFGSHEFVSKGTVTEALYSRLGMVVPVAVVAMLVMAVARRQLAVFLDVPQFGVWLILVHFIAVCALSIIGAVLQASQQMARYGVSLFLDKALMLVCVVVLSTAKIANPLVVLVCYASSSLSVAIWGSWMVRTRFRGALPSPAVYREMVLFSAPLLLSTWAFFFGTNWIDLVILKKYVPMSGIGVYSLATQLAGVIQQITIIFSTLILPHLSLLVRERQDVRIKVFLERLLPYWLLGMSILFCLVLLGTPAVVPLIFGQAFRGTVPVLVLMMAASSAFAVFNAVVPLINAYGATWTLSRICLASATANIVLDLAFIPRFGVMGSAVATIIAYSGSAILALRYVQTSTGGRVFRLGGLATPVLVECACFLLLDGIWFYIAASIGAAITAFILVAVFRLFDDEDVTFFKQLDLPMPFISGARVSR